MHLITFLWQHGTFVSSLTSGTLETLVRKMHSDISGLMNDMMYNRTSLFGPLDRSLFLKNFPMEA